MMIGIASFTRRAALLAGASTLGLLLVGCGPALIGVGANELSDSDSPPDFAPSISALTENLGARPSSGSRTSLGFEVFEAFSRPIWVRFEFEVDDAGVKRTGIIPIDHLPIAGDDVASDGMRWRNLAAGPAPNGVEYRAQWNHVATLRAAGIGGPDQVEFRSVRVIAKFGPNDAPETELGQQEILTPQAIGLQDGVLQDVAFTKSSTEPKGTITITANYSDYAADGRTAEFEVDYSIDAGATWIAVRDSAGDTALRAATASTSPDLNLPIKDRETRQLSFEFDPTADVYPDPNGGSRPLPLGEYDQLAFRVRVRDELAIGPYRPERNAAPGPYARSNGGSAIRIGKAPRIQSVTVVDPVNDPGRPSEQPFLKLPIKVRVLNDDPNCVATARIRGKYTLNTDSTEHEMSFVESDSNTSPQFTLQPNQAQTRYVVWNVQADEGLGLAHPPLTTSELINRVTAQICLTSELVAELPDARNFADLNPVPASTTTSLNTPPFVDFISFLRRNGTNALLDAESLISSNDQRAGRTNRTLDLFYRRSSDGSQDGTLGTDQQFSPLIVTPPTDEHVSRNTSGTELFISQIIPTDIRPGPDCLATSLNRNSRQLFFFEWQENGEIRRNMNQAGDPQGFTERGDVALARERGQVVGFQGPGGSTVEAALRVLYDEPASTGSPLRVKPNVFVPPDPVPAPPAPVQWTPYFPGEGLPTFEQPSVDGVSASSNHAARGVFGEFDGDPSTVDYVVFSPGVERGTVRSLVPTPPNPAPVPGTGWHHRFSLEMNTSGAVVVAQEPVALPIPDDLSVEARIEPSRWFLRAWPNPEDPNRPGLLLARFYAAAGPLERHVALDVLVQEAPGVFAQSWQPLPFERPRDLNIGIVAAAPCASPRADDAGFFCASRRTVPGGSGDRRLVDVLIADLDPDSLNASGQREPELILVFAPETTRASWITCMVRTHRRNRSGIARWAWRPVAILRDATDFLPASQNPFFDASRVQLVDINGDGALDLIARAIGNSGSAWGVLSSSLTGVAGDLVDAPQNANRPCALPAVADFDGDGIDDVLTAGSVYAGDDGGEYTRDTPLVAFEGTTAFVVQKMFGVGIPDSDEVMEVLHYDRAFDPAIRPDLNRVVTLSGFGTPSFQVASTTPIEPPPGTRIAQALPLLTIEPTNNGVDKDLAVVLDTGAGRQLHRFALNGSRSAFESSAVWSTDVADMNGRFGALVATARRRALRPDEPLDPIPPARCRRRSVGVPGVDPQRMVRLRAAADHGGRRPPRQRVRRDRQR